MRYLPLTPDDRSEMLARIGIPDIDALFADIPVDKQLKSLPDLPRTSHTHPLPKRLVPASLNCFWNSSKLPNAFLISSPTRPLGEPPPFGFMICQNMV